jgi:hypothetical protein
VGEEGKATKDDPGPEDPGRDGKDQDLDEAVLDEGEFEWLEDSSSLMRMNPICI